MVTTEAKRTRGIIAGSVHNAAWRTARKPAAPETEENGCVARLEALARGERLRTPRSVELNGALSG